MSQNYTWPSVSVQATNPSVGLNGATAPTSSTEVAGVNGSGNLTPISVDNSGNQNVNVVSSALPTGAATAANQTSEITQLTGIHSDTTSLDGKTVHVDTGAVVVASSALPTGAATSALQTSGNSSLTAIASSTSSIDGKTVHVDTGNVTISTALPAGANNIGSITDITGTVSLPTGASTLAAQNTGNASLSSIDGKIVHVDTGAVVVSSSALPTGAATSANQSTIITNTANLSRLSGSLVPTAYDEVVINYVGATTDFSTIVYKLATVTVKTLTFTYDGSDRLTDVVAS